MGTVVLVEEGRLLGLVVEVVDFPDVDGDVDGIEEFWWLEGLGLK